MPIAQSLSSLKHPPIPDRELNIRDFGAQPDSSHLNTDVFRRCIQQCADEGGGSVCVPAGTWRTGPIHFRSGVRLRLDEGSVLSFSTRPEDYLPAVLTRWEGVECYNYSPLLYAHRCERIGIVGAGTLQGNGESWWPWKWLRHREAAADVYSAQARGIPVEERRFGIPEMLRPSFFQPFDCRDVLIEGVTFRNGPMWTVHPVYCEDVIVRKIRVLTDDEGPNTDGLNPDSCRNVLVEDSLFSTGDDCIAINSGMNEDGWRVGRPSENILIRNCRMEKGHGGLVIGSAMSGDVRNVYAHDCECVGTERGIRLKSMRGRGGTVTDVRFERFSMRDILHEAITIDMYYGASTADPVSDTAPRFSDIRIRDSVGRGAARAVHLRGLPEQPLENITLEDVDIRAESGGQGVDVDGLSLRNVQITAGSGPPWTHTRVRLCS